jgi:hypothetical protein
MSNRDYIYEIQKKELKSQHGKRLWAILGDSINESEILTKVTHEKGVVSIDNYAQRIVIAADGDTGSKVLMDYFDDPKVRVNRFQERHTGLYKLAKIIDFSRAIYQPLLSIGQPRQESLDS